MEDAKKQPLSDEQAEAAAGGSFWDYFKTASYTCEKCGKSFTTLKGSEDNNEHHVCPVCRGYVM